MLNIAQHLAKAMAARTAEAARAGAVAARRRRTVGEILDVDASFVAGFPEVVGEVDRDRPNLVAGE